MVVACGSVVDSAVVEAGSLALLGVVVPLPLFASDVVDELHAMRLSAKAATPAMRMADGFMRVRL